MPRKTLGITQPKLVLGFLLVSAGILVSCGGTSITSGEHVTESQQIATFSNVVIVVLENQGFDAVMNSSDMPFLKSLTQQYGLAANYFGTSGHSLANHMMLAAGAIVPDDTAIWTGDNIVRHLVANGKSWKSYAENLPSVGYTGNAAYPYEKSHNPFAYFSDVVDSQEQLQRLVPFTQFASDLANGTLPTYSYLLPNERNNAHDCPVAKVECTNSEKLMAADAWLQNNLTPLLDSSSFRSGGLLAIVFDSAGASDRTNGGGHVVAAIVSSRSRAGFRSDRLYQHDDLLRLTAEAAGLRAFPGQAASASNMAEFFTK